MSEKKCECEICKCGGNNRIFEWIDNGTKKNGRSIKVAVKDYIENRSGEKKDKADVFYNKYCIGRFKLNDKSTYTLVWKDNDLIPIKVNEKKKSLNKTIVHINTQIAATPVLKGSDVQDVLEQINHEPTENAKLGAEKIIDMFENN